MKDICVVLAIYWPALREGLRAILRACAGLEVVGVAVTADEAVNLSRATRPDAVLIDYRLPGALRAASAIRQTHPQAVILVLVDRLDPDNAARLAAAGATGYLLSEIGLDGFAATLRGVRDRPPRSWRGGDGEAPGSLPGKHTPKPSGATTSLTSREVDVLKQLAEGRTAKQVAAALTVTEGTVKTHVRHILQKLGVRNRTQAIADALRGGLIR